MKIKKKKDKIIVEIPFWSKRYNPYMPDEDMGEYPTLTGLIIKHRPDKNGIGNDYDEIGFAGTIDMDYKSKPDQVNGFVVMWNGNEKTFIKKCEELGLAIQIIE